MGKKRWPLFVGLSVAVGVVSSVFYKKQQARSQETLAALKKIYAGQWWFIDQRQHVQHTLALDSDLALAIDDRLFEIELLELTAERLILRDKYGYLLIFTPLKTAQLSFYDEANDQTYLLEFKQAIA